MRLASTYLFPQASYNCAGPSLYILLSTQLTTQKPLVSYQLPASCKYGFYDTEYTLKTIRGLALK